MEYNTGNYDKYMTKNPLKKFMVERLNRRIIEIVGAHLGKKENSTILDAGCGEGFVDHLLLSTYPNIKIVGLEYTHEALEIAREMNPSVEYIQGDICDMPFEDNSFDFVICTEVLEHLETPDIAVREIARVGKGKYLITVPHEPWFCLGNLLVLKNVKRLGNPIDHLNHWTKKSFKRFINENIVLQGKLDGWRIGGSFPWIVAKYEE